MRLGLCKASNFGSYRELEFDFYDKGLCLIYGPTGSGKSTIPDLAAWALYGRTAKQGNADEVRSWTADNSPTEVQLQAYLSSTVITVTRIRGKASQNDLYWTEHGYDTHHRGKDINDTQKLLNARLGMDFDIYLSSAYFSEFSTVSSFFVANAKARRTTFELLTDLLLPVTIAARGSEACKASKQSLNKCVDTLSGLLGALKQVETALDRSVHSRDTWEQSYKAKREQSSANYDKYEEARIQELQARAEELERLEASILPGDSYQNDLYLVDKALEDLGPGKCEACGAPKQNDKRQKLISRRGRIVLESTQNKQRQKEYKDGLKALERLSNAPNPHSAQKSEQEQTVNPHTQTCEEHERELASLAEKMEVLSEDKLKYENEVWAYQELGELCQALRGELLKKAVAEIECATNRYLERYFDAEIKVAFQLDGDSLDVAIHKSGHECSYSQLSKGQRALLKLCFTVSVMKASANKVGLHMDTLFMDEALDGLDANFKVKAFDMFQQLQTEHGSIFLIDHSTELHQMFSNRYKVELVGDTSVVEVENE